MVQLDAAAMNLKRRFEDPNIAASLEAQQAYTRALAPGGTLPLPLHMSACMCAGMCFLPLLFGLKRDIYTACALEEDAC